MQILLKAQIGWRGLEAAQPRSTTCSESPFLSCSRTDRSMWAPSQGLKASASVWRYHLGFECYFNKQKASIIFRTENNSRFYHVTSFATRLLWFFRSSKQFFAWSVGFPQTYTRIYVFNENTPCHHTPHNHLHLQGERQKLHVPFFWSSDHPF